MRKKYKIAVNLNRVTTPYKKDFEKARHYHSKHGVDIAFIFKKIDVHGYKSEFDENLNRWLIKGVEGLVDLDHTADVDMFVFDMGEWSTPEGSLFPLKPETPNGSCRLINGKPFICIGTYITDHTKGETWVQIAHEIMHSYVQNAYMRGINVPDVMDTYRDNSNPNSPIGNFAEQWNLLIPYLTAPSDI